jgi:16S rRNA (uracil1498-N3)-methyltransferase
VVELPREEAEHAVRVLRLRAGDAVHLVDGRGHRVLAALIAAEARSCTATVQAVVPSGIPVLPAIHLAVAPTKQIDRFEWMLEKCTELGVQRITPLLTERTERGHLRHDRLLKVLVGAMKQSQRDHLPLLDAPTTLAALLAGPLPAQRFYGYCLGAHRPLMAAYAPGQEALVAIGPEGDFTPDEAERLTQQGFAAVSLGAARLRTETAAVAACTWMNFAQQV